MSDLLQLTWVRVRSIDIQVSVRLGRGSDGRFVMSRQPVGFPVFRRRLKHHGKFRSNFALKKLNLSSTNPAEHLDHESGARNRSEYHGSNTCRSYVRHPRDHLVQY